MREKEREFYVGSKPSIKFRNWSWKGARVEVESKDLKYTHRYDIGGGRRGWRTYPCTEFISLEGLRWKKRTRFTEQLGEPAGEGGEEKRRSQKVGIPSRRGKPHE